jgi:hypothetical protein
MYRFNFYLFLVFTCFLTQASSFFSSSAFAQFPPAAGMPGTTAIHKDSSCFIYFANQCTYVPGYKNISMPDSGRLAPADVAPALGRPDGLSLSLGDSGYVLVFLNTPLFDGEGFDFAVFENSFSDQFLELAFVEVSSDGVHFARFPSVSFTQDTLQQGPFDNNMQASLLNNLAGKYRGMYGTPFNLEDLPDYPWLNKDSISFLRIVDVVGSIQTSFASFDSQGHIINDPFPTPFPSCGFDLDGIGFIHARFTGNDSPSIVHEPFFFPSLCHVGEPIRFSRKIGFDDSISVFDLKGKLVRIVSTGDTTALSFAQGTYILQCQTIHGVLKGKLIVVAQ